MAYGSNPLEVKWVSLTQLTENPWNPNRMSPDKQKKLAAEIRDHGFLAPVLVRPLGDRFQIIDGEHRFHIARELGLPAIPAIVVAAAEDEARIKTLQLNGLRGENDPGRLARLLAELSAGLSLEALAQLLPWSLPEIQQMIALAAKEDPDVEKFTASSWSLTPPALDLFAVVVTPEQREEIERTVRLARTRLDLTDDGEALAAICRALLAE